MTEPTPSSSDAGRMTRVWLAAALGVAVSGYAVGRAQTTRGVNEPRSAVALGPVGAGVAPAWSELALARRGPNADLRTRVPETARPARSTGPRTQTPDEREVALAGRAARRAYDGAPPVIPHPVDAVSVQACLACHQHGLRLGAVVAPALPHAAFTSCTQCHAPGAPSELAARAGPPLTGSGFEGLAAPSGRERAWPGAPPVIPHGTWMREDCMTCHGPNGPAGLQTSHPWRQSCTQCHASRARSP